MNKKARIVLKISDGRAQPKVIVEVQRASSREEKSVVRDILRKTQQLDSYVAARIRLAHEQAKARLRHAGRSIRSSTRPLNHAKMVSGMSDFLLGILVGITITAILAAIR